MFCNQRIISGELFYSYLPAAFLVNTIVVIVSMVIHFRRSRWSLVSPILSVKGASNPIFESVSVLPLHTGSEIAALLVMRDFCCKNPRGNFRRENLSLLENKPLQLLTLSNLLRGMFMLVKRKVSLPQFLIASKLLNDIKRVRNCVLDSFFTFNKLSLHPSIHVLFVN